MKIVTRDRIALLGGCCLLRDCNCAPFSVDLNLHRVVCHLCALLSMHTYLVMTIEDVPGE
jgi:hypothetical protein